MTRALRLCALAAPLLAGLAAGASANPLGLGIFEVVYSEDGRWTTKPTHISPADLAKILKESLPQYKSILTVTNACFSEIYLDEMAKQLAGDTAHLGPSSKAETSKIEQDRTTKDVKGYAPSVADELSAGKSAKDAHAAAAKADPNNPDGDNGAQVKKRTEAYEKWRAAQPDPSKYPPAAQEVPEHPQMKTTGNGGAVTLKNGTSNHALIVVGLPGRADDKVLEKYEAALRKAGFDSVTVLNDIKAPKQGNDPSPSWATVDNLKASLQDIAKKMNKDEHFVFVALGHTVVESRSQATNQGHGAGGGQVFQQGQSVDDIVLSDEDWYRLREKSPLQDSPTMDREYAPWFFLRTFSESFAGDPLVDVWLNGVPAGTISLLNSSTGGYYTLPVDLGLLPLILGPDQPGHVRVDFGFRSASDHFRIATADDLAGWSGAGSNYGVGLASPFSGSVPEPAPWGILAAGLAGVLGGRARRRAARRP